MITPLVLVSLVAPGAIVVRRLSLHDCDRLSVAVAFSLLMLFHGWWGLWIAGVPAIGCTSTVVIVTSLSLVVGWRDLRDLFAVESTRWQAVGFGVVAGHALLLQAAVFCYSGGPWLGDWLGHFTQTGFFLADGDPQLNRFPAGDAITARPPLMNIVAAHFCRLSSLTFGEYQIVMTLLSALACLPAFMVAGRIARVLGEDHKRVPLAVTAAIVVLPAFAENAVYPWTKLLAAFFVIAGVVFWADGVGDPRRPRRFIAAILLSGGVLTHYSAAVYVVAITLYECGALAAAILGRTVTPALRIWIANAKAAIVGMVVMMPWFGWALVKFGIGGTLTTNTAVTDAAAFSPAGNLIKIALNLRDTLVPYFMRPEPDVMALLRSQLNPVGRVRDLCFVPYQVNFPAASGVVGWWLIVISVAVLWRRLNDAAARWFWAVALGVGGILGVAVHGGRDHNGLAHICLHPLMIIAAVCVVIVIGRMSLLMRTVLLVGWAIDYTLGILLQAWVQSWRFELVGSSGVNQAIGNSAGLSVAATENLLNKQQLTIVFLSERLALIGIVPSWLIAIAAMIAVITVTKAAREFRKKNPVGGLSRR